MAGERGMGPQQPHDREQKAPVVTSVRKAIVIGALGALLIGAATSLATARLTNRQSEVDHLQGQASQQQATFAELTSQLSDNQAKVDELTKQLSDQEAKVAAVEKRGSAADAQVKTLEAEKASLQEQLSKALNPSPVAAPTASLTAKWVLSYSPASPETVVCVTIANTSNTDLKIAYSYSQFTALDGANFAYPPRLHTPGYSIQLSTPLLSGELNPGEQRRGELLYDVPGKAVLSKLVWNTGFGDPPEIRVDLPVTSGLYIEDAVSRC